MRRFLCDTNVLVYTLGAAHPYQEPCRAIIDRQGRGLLNGELTAVVVAELAHQRLRQTRDRGEAARRAREFASLFPVIGLDAADAGLALDLYAAANRLDVFDALLAAAALNRGIEIVLSADRAFDSVDGLVRVDPLDEQAVAALE